MLALASPASAQLTEQKTPGVRVVYVDGTESFLVPQATRTALNSLKFQKNIFGFDPKKDPLVLLVDLSDKGNAGASTVPGDLVTVQIAPIAFIYETIATNERMNTLMNHEFVHIATMDEPAGTRSVLPEAVRRQGAADRRAARVDPVLLPDLAARGGAALVSRRHRGLLRHVDGRRPRARAERLRRDGLPLDGRRQHAVLRPARPGL